MTLSEVMASLDPAERAAVEARFKELVDELRATDTALGDYTVNLIRTLPEAAAKLRAEHDALRARVATLERDADMLDRGELIPAEIAARLTNYATTVGQLRARVACLLPVPVPRIEGEVQRYYMGEDREEWVKADAYAALSDYGALVEMERDALRSAQDTLRARVARDSEAYTRMETRAIDAEARVAELEALLTEALCWVPRGGLPGKFKEKAEKRLSGNKDSQ